MNAIQRVTLVLAAGILVFLTGCGPDWKAEIESDTDWYIQYGGASGTQWTFSTQQGSGNKTVNLPDDDRVCIRVQQTGGGYVRVELKDEGGGPFGIFSSRERDAEVNVSGGSMEMCSEGQIPSGY